MNKKILIGSIIAICILIGISFTSVVGYRNRFDSIWKDDFDNDSRADIINCFIKDGNVSINKLKNHIKFDYKDGKSHKAYSYETRRFPNLYPPNFHIFCEYKLKEHTDEIDNIKKYDRKAYTTSTDGAKKYVVHHFRFKIDIKPENINELDISWNGKGQSISEIKLFFWKYDNIFPNLGEWVVIAITEMNDNWVTLDFTLISNDIIQALKKNNILDISIVGISDNEGCNLSTDYVRVACETGIFYPV